MSWSYLTQILTKTQILKLRLQLLGQLVHQNYIGSTSADCKAGPAEDTELFNIIFDEVSEQYQKGYITEEIDQLSTKLSLAISEQESAKAFTTTDDVTAEYSVTLDSDTDSDLAKLQNDAVEIALVGSNPYLFTVLREEDIPKETTEKQR